MNVIVQVFRAINQSGWISTVYEKWYLFFNVPKHLKIVIYFLRLTLKCNFQIEKNKSIIRLSN